MDYHNEIDPYCAQWLRNLMKAELIPQGFVDERDIRDVHPVDLWGFDRCHFFSGIGGWAYALRLAGVPDDRPGIWTGSCPCQPFSLAGQQKGFDDSRHLWPEFKRLIAVGRPAIALGEQVASASAWLRLVRSDLEALGYAVGAIPVEAASAGADHLRDRFWFVADADSAGLRNESRRCDGANRSDSREHLDDRPVNLAEPESHRERWLRQFEQSGGRSSEARGSSTSSAIPDTDFLDAGAERQQRSGQFSRVGGDSKNSLEWVVGANGKARRIKSGIRLLAHDVPNRVAKLRALGNSIVPQCAAAFIKAALDP